MHWAWASLLCDQDVVFKSKFDTAARTCLRFNQAPSDFLANDTVKDAYTAAMGSGEEENPVEMEAAIVAAEDAGAQKSLLEQLLASPATATVATSLKENLKPDDTEIVKTHEELARNTVASLIKLLDSTDKLSTLVNSIRSTAFGKMRGDGSGCILIFYDQKASGENAKCPRYAPPPLRKEHLEKVVLAALLSRSTDDADIDFDDPKPETYPPLHSGDVCLVRPLT